MLHLTSPKLATALIAGGLALIPAFGHANVVDLTGTNNTGRINHAEFDWTPEQPTGTGYIKSFLRTQAKGSEQGYNTSGGIPFDDKAGPWTHDITLADLAESIVTIGDIRYYRLLLDVNEPGSSSYITLDRLEFYTSDVGGKTTTDVSSLGVLRWSMDGAGDSWVILDAARNHGSGSGDMYAYIPVKAFKGALSTDFVYMYTQFGTTAGGSTEGGFEEWSIDTTPEEAAHSRGPVNN